MASVGNFFSIFFSLCFYIKGAENSPARDTNKSI